VDLRTLVKILARRWIVVIPTILVAALVGSQLMSSVEPEYEAKGALLILLPAQSTVGGDPGVAPPEDGEASRNAYLELRAGLNTTAKVFATIMNDNRLKQDFRQQGLTTDYEVTVDDDAPVLNVVAKNQRPRIAIDTANAVLDAIPQQIALREAKENVAEEDRMGTDPILEPTRATALNAARTRALVAFIALGIAAVISVALLVESWAQSAQSRRDRRRLTVAVPGPAAVAASGPTAAPAPAAPPTAKRTSVRNRAGANDDQPSTRERVVGGDEGGDVAEAGDGTRPATAAKQPGRARAKPRRRSGAAS
jgi:capsular polysaccharide biosynthesis protein